MEKTSELPREANIRAIIAVSAFRPGAWKVFLRFALEELTEEQLLILLQRIGEWMNENPPKGTT
jgi:hypothetical protein